MNSTTLPPKKSPSSNGEINREGPKQRREAGRSSVSSRTSLLAGSNPAEAAARRQRWRAEMAAAIPLEKVHPALRELPRETMPTPYVIAEIVCREGRHHVGSDVPMRYETWLVRRTRQLYASNNGFNRRLRSAAGRDYLYAFLRHWLASRLTREHPRLARRLPAGFAIGLASQ
jgi:hypothetical protein